MVRRATRRQKGRYTRKRKQVILIATEGDNKTEKTYFHDFNGRVQTISIVFADGNSTDPVKIVKDAIQSAKKRGIDFDYGDKVYAVFDTDFNKEEQITEARKTARENNMELILSNPCFEVWILQHFRFSTRGYNSNDDVIAELINRWPDYRKSIGSFRYVSDRTEIAIENARKLIDFHNDINPRTDIERRNPSTDVYKLVEMITSERQDVIQTK